MEYLFFNLKMFQMTHFIHSIFLNYHFRLMMEFNSFLNINYNYYFLYYLKNFIILNRVNLRVRILKSCLLFFESLCMFSLTQTKCLHLVFSLFNFYIYFILSNFLDSKFNYFNLILISINIFN